jgi:hypothetical protein
VVVLTTAVSLREQAHKPTLTSSLFKDGNLHLISHTLRAAGQPPGQ